MYKGFLDALVLTIASLWLHSGTGNSLNIHIVPNMVNELTHNEVTISCSLDNSDGDVKDIAILELTKAGLPIAVIRQNSELSIAKGMEKKFKAQGKITTPAFDSYIQATLRNPETEDSGPYECIMFFLNELSVIKETRTKENLTVSDSDQELRSSVKYLVDVVSSLKTDLTAQKDYTDRLEIELQRQKKVSQEQNDRLEIELQRQKNESQESKEQTTLLSTKLQVQEEQLVQQEQLLKELNDTENEVVYFTALHDKPETGPFVAGKVMVFGNVVVNVGGGFNGHTGVFTAPVSGLYVFHISLGVPNGKWIELHLRSSEGQVLARLVTGDSDYYSQSAASCVVRLDIGVQVTPFIYGRSVGFALTHYTNSAYINKFYGYLSKSL